MEKPSKNQEKQSNPKFQSKDRYLHPVRPHFNVRNCCGNNFNYPIYPCCFFDSSRWDGEWLKHNNYHLIAIEMVLDGEILYAEDQRKIVVHPGSVFLIVPHSNVQISNHQPGQKQRKLVLLCGGNAPGLICEALQFAQDTLITLDDPAPVKDKLYRIGNLMKDQSHPDQAALETYELMLMLRQQYRRTQPEIPREILEMKLFIHSHFKEKISLTDLVDEFGCSEATIRRLFHQYFATTPGHYLNQLRLDHAVMLLRNPEIPIKEVGFRCGYASALYFAEAFRQAQGCTPTVYRKQFLAGKLPPQP